MKKIILVTALFVVLGAKAQTIDSQLRSFIKTWIGAPYRFGGTTMKGIDCSAFVQKLYSSVFSLEIPRTAYYQFKATERIKKEDITIGDLIFFNSRLSPSGWHVGVYIGNDQFIHSANRKEGVKISCLQDPLYKGIYKGAGRLKS